MATGPWPTLLPCRIVDRPAKQRLSVLPLTSLTLTTLAHHMDDVWMGEAYRRVHKDAAAGVDGVTAVQYEADQEANLTGSLLMYGVLLLPKP